MATKKLLKVAKEGKTPLTPSESKRVSKVHAVKSDNRIHERNSARANTYNVGEAKIEPSRKKVVTRDNRPDVSKTSNVSGVSVNGKTVRRGKVKAAEKATKSGRISRAVSQATKVAKVAGPVGYVASLATSIANKRDNPTDGGATRTMMDLLTK